MKKFVHLHLHTEYSLIDSIIQVDPLIQQIQSLDMPAVGMSDQSNLFAMVKFYQAAISKGIKPIIGAEIWLENPEDITKPYSIILLCQNKVGYNKLTCLISQSFTDGQHLDKALVKKEWLTPQSTEGLIALSSALAGDIGQAFIANKPELAKQAAKYWQNLFPNRFYIELQRIGQPHEEDYIHFAMEVAQELALPVVATNNVRFLARDDFEAHEARVCIHQGMVLADPKRPKLYTEQQYLRSAEEMMELFSDIPEAIENTVEIAKRCNLTLQLGKNFLPDFPVPEGFTVESYLAKSAEDGLEERLNVLFPDDILRKEKAPIYRERLQVELSVINTMGFPGYFLIVADFIQWAKQNGVPVGPGRGSGAGSLVAYAIKITDLDPLQYDLLFERFLNPERVSMPDFDVDFCMEGRDRVIDYVAHKYGRESVSQIITFGTMAAKAVVRDVGRVLNHPYGFVDKIAKMIPFEIGITLEKALEEPALKERYENDEEVRILIDLAKKLEGIARNAGKHAGGVVISPGLLTDFTPLYCEQGTHQYVTQFDKDDVEAIGLVKFDFLGLRTLTIIDWAVHTINQKRAAVGEEPLDITLIPTDDHASYQLLKLCQTTAVFQLESRGMKELIKRLQPDCFEDIIALVALFRPGPLQSGMVDDFINRKHGRTKVEYLHPALEQVLKPTYGVIVYQEQVMQIAQILAGYSLGGADLLRRAMGKKKPEEMAKQREIFIKGSIENKVDEKTAAYIFDLMEKFAGYGFNKSHSAAYALVAYQTAWLKAHYPAEFMAAVLSSDMDNTDKVVTFLEECQHMKLTVLPPDVNQGEYKFTVSAEGKIIYGLGAIKGVGEAALASIFESRNEHGEYLSLFDFCQRVDLRKVTRRVLEVLIKSGAMDKFGDRASLFASIDDMLQAANQLERNQQMNQVDLFALLHSNESSRAIEPPMKKAEPWSLKDRLKGEAETLGYYFSGHPFDDYVQDVAGLCSYKLKELLQHTGQTLLVTGMITQIRYMKSKRGHMFAIIGLDDKSARVEAVLFPEIFENSKQLLVINQLIFIEAEISIDDFTNGVRLTAKKVQTLDEVRQQMAKYLLLQSEKNKISPEKINEIAQVLQQHTGTCPVMLQYVAEEGKVIMPLPNHWKVKLSTELLEKLKPFANPKVVSKAEEINY